MNPFFEELEKVWTEQGDYLDFDMANAKVAPLLEELRAHKEEHNTNEAEPSCFVCATERENTRLRRALEEVSQFPTWGEQRHDEIVAIARAALNIESDVNADYTKKDVKDEAVK